MHEFSLLADLIKKIDAIVEKEKARKVVKVQIKIGALAHISGEHFREHFEHAIIGSHTEGAYLEIEEATDETASDAQSIVLLSIEVED